MNAVLSMPKDLPAELAQLVKEFLGARPGLSTLEGARGQCTNTTYQFVVFMRMRDFPFEFDPVDFYFDGQSVVVSDPMLGLDVIPHTFYWNNGFDGHTIAWINEWFIDLTARQFGAHVPFPLIWHESEDEVAVMRRVLVCQVHERVPALSKLSHNRERSIEQRQCEAMGLAWCDDGSAFVAFDLCSGSWVGELFWSGEHLDCEVKASPRTR